MSKVVHLYRSKSPQPPTFQEFVSAQPLAESLADLAQSIVGLLERLEKLDELSRKISNPQLKTRTIDAIVARRYALISAYSELSERVRCINPIIGKL